MSTMSVLKSLLILLSSGGHSAFVWPARCHGCVRDTASFHSRRLNHYHEARGGRLHHSQVSAKPDDSLSRERARDAFSKLAKKGRSWRRLRHMVDLACMCTEPPVCSIADIGCDHGLLTLGLAVSGRFQKVIGVDISERALSDGAIALYGQMLEDLKKNDNSEQLSTSSLFPVEFCVGDGLSVLEPGQADVLCIAGMGVNTMMQILYPSQLNRVGCHSLILQPTNSRPRNLISLYDSLDDAGWSVTNERIEFLSSRWYISALFTRHPDVPAAANSIPGQFLDKSEAYRSFVQHHRQWIERDSKNGIVDKNDRRWLEFIGQD